MWFPSKLSSITSHVRRRDERHEHRVAAVAAARTAAPSFLLGAPALPLVGAPPVAHLALLSAVPRCRGASLRDEFTRQCGSQRLTERQAVQCEGKGTGNEPVNGGVALAALLELLSRDLLAPAPSARVDRFPIRASLFHLWFVVGCSVHCAVVPHTTLTSHPTQAG